MRKIHLFILITALAFSAPAAAAADTTAPVGAEGNTNLSNDPSPSGTDTPQPQQPGTDTTTGTDTQQTGTDAQQTGTDAQPAGTDEQTEPAEAQPELAAKLAKDAKIVEGYYYLQPFCSKKRVMGVAGKSKKVGAKVQLAAQKYGKYETFYIKPAGSGLYTIRNMNSNLFLAAENAGTANKTLVIQEKEDEESLAQKWYISKKGKGFYIQSAISQNVLTVQNSKDRTGQKIFLYTARNKKGQRWDIIRFIKPDGNWKSSKRVWKNTKEDYKILGNIIGAIESGEQIYGNLNYASYDPPYNSTPNEHTITIGWPQCYGPEAGELLRRIFNLDKASFRKIDSALPASQRIENYLNRDITAMRWRPNAKQKKVIVKLLKSEAGHEAQDAQFRGYMESFVRDCTSTYTKNAWAVVMYCEIRHLGGKNGATRIFNACGGNYSLRRIMAVLKQDQYNTRSNYQVGDRIFWDRHECVCTFLETFMK